MTVTRQALDTVYSQNDTTAARQRNHCPGQLVLSLTACRRDPGARVLSLAMLWPRPSSVGLYSTQHLKLRSLDSSAMATAWHVDVYTN